LLLVDGSIRVADFHMVKPLGVNAPSAEVHQDSVGYTFHYTSPEALRGRVTKASDQYSLAVTYYRLRTGHLPFEALGSAIEMMMRQMEGRIDLSRLPEAERRVVTQALAVSPEERFPSCVAFVAALETAVGLAPVAGPPKPERPA